MGPSDELSAAHSQINLAVEHLLHILFSLSSGQKTYTKSDSHLTCKLLEMLQVLQHPLFTMNHRDTMKQNHYFHN